MFATAGAHLGCCGPEELYVSGPDALPVFVEGVDDVFFSVQQHEGVPCGPTVCLPDEQHAFFVVQQIHAFRAIAEEVHLPSEKTIFGLQITTHQLSVFLFYSDYFAILYKVYFTIPNLLYHTMFSTVQ